MTKKQSQNKPETKGKIAKLDYKTNLIFLSIAVLILAGITIWISSELIRITKQTQEQRTQLNVLDQREESYKQLERDYDAIVDNYQIIDNALPDQNNFVKFIVMLEKEAKQDNVKLEITFPDQPEIENNLLAFTIKITGQRNNVLKYMTGLKKAQYHIEFSSLEMNKSGNNAVAIETTIKIGIDETFQPSQISS